MFALALCALATLTGCKGEDSAGVPVVGLDDNGKLISKFVNAKALEGELAKSLSMVEESTLAALAQKPQATGWNLKAIVVGVGVNIEVGIRYLVTLGQGGRWRLVFSQSGDVVIPNQAEVTP